MKVLSTLKVSKQLNEKTISVPETFNHKKIDFISFGTITLKVNITYHNGPMLLISEDVFQHLKIPYENKIHFFIYENTIHVGPLVGVYTAGFTSSLVRPIGERSLFFSKLLSADRKVGAFMFLFGPKHIKWDEGVIDGFLFTDKGWCQQELPFPHVIYDRLPNRKTENHSLLKETKDRLQQQYLIPWFNPGFFNKWEVHQKLSLEENISHYLPETHSKISITLLEEMLSRYPFVFLKPSNGSLGLGVYKIVYHREENYYYCRYKDEKMQNRLQRFSSLEKLLGRILAGKDLNQYIVQQGIALWRINDTPVDFRVHTNKNENGDWVVSAIAGKLSGKGSITTHLNSGGIVRVLDDICKDDQEFVETKRLLETAAIQLSMSLDRQMKGYIGEIGFDFGIDKEKKIWLFEANSKPGRSIFHLSKLRTEELETRKLPLQYALYLTEQSLHSLQVVES
ncbi:YheC/YheD family endospore coat-associated protein [Sutcliffiella cohnii]|uniref:YheC/YheD family endospore coat-associated protein n=1 Tax=Sutcliffiella cohnii TaxID=33932 RepID=UPI002E1CE3C7|nr:YheC/YheD family protein [Sutcliffiella cohnii]